MHWAGRKLQIASVLHKNYVLGWKEAPERFYINFESGIESGICIGEEVSSREDGSSLISDATSCPR